MKFSFAHLGLYALNLLFPPRCGGCGKYGSFLCSACETSLPPLRPPYCKVCAQPAPPGVICWECFNAPPIIDGIRAPFIMEGTIRECIHSLKYHNLRAMAPTLASLLARWLETNAVPGDVLVPVPLHKRRLRSRGYNQSDLLAKELGKIAGLPVLDGVLVRTRETPPQVSLAREERARNVEGSFQCTADVRGLRANILDDVVTTGSTMSACSGALRAGGAEAVWGLALAR